MNDKDLGEVETVPRTTQITKAKPPLVGWDKITKDVRQKKRITSPWQKECQESKMR